MKFFLKIIFFLIIVLLNVKFVNASNVGLSTYGIDLLNPGRITYEGSNNAADFLGIKAGAAVSVILGFAALLVFILIVYGGVKILFSNGKKEDYTLGLNIIKTTVIGLIIILLSYTITSFFVKNVSNTTGMLDSSNSVCPRCEANQYCCSEMFWGCDFGQCELITGVERCACSSTEASSCLGTCTACSGGSCPTSDRVSNYSGFCTPEKTNNGFYCKRN